MVRTTGAAPARRARAGPARVTRFRGALFTATGMVARASNQLSTVLVTLFATRFLGPKDFGVFALASLTTTLIRTLLYTGAFEYLLKTRTPRQCSTECLAANAVLAVGLSLLVGLAMAISIAIFGSSRLTTIMLVLLPSNLIAALGAWRESLLLRTRRLGLYYALTSIAVFGAAIIGIVLMFLGMRLYALVWQTYLRNIILLALYMMVGGAVLSDRFDRAKLVEVGRWASARYASTVFNFGSNYGVDAIIGLLLSPTAVGLYRASNRLVTAVSDVFTQPVRMIAMTTFSARAANGRGSNDLWPAMQTLVIALGGSVLAGVATVSNLVVPLVLGKAWAGAALLLPIIACSRALSLFDAVNGPLLVAYDYQRIAFKRQIYVSIAGFAALLLTARFGLFAATLAVLCSGIAGRVFSVALTVRLIPPERGRGVAIVPTILAPILATAAGALLVQALTAGHRVAPIPRAALAIAGGALAWAVVMLLLRHRFAAMARVLQSTDAEMQPNAISPELAQSVVPMTDTR